jgi:hypothetical protein
MINSLTYLTRGCPRHCEYCALREAVGIGKQLDVRGWKEAFRILHELNVDFNLVLGNETWLLGTGLIDIFKDNKIPYALYTTCPEPIFSKHKYELFDSGVIDNLSCGIDYPIIEGLLIDDDSYAKSKSAWWGFKWIKQFYPEVDTQGTITIHKKNLPYVLALVKSLSQIGVFVGINFIHWNRDGKYDFFPKKEEIADLLFTKDDYIDVTRIMYQVRNLPGNLLQNPEFIAQPPSLLLNMGWHCHGNPYGGPTVDSDGKLRCCGYRRGEETSKLSIFDLPKRLLDWKWAVWEDAMRCPGCAWSYPWMYNYWERNDRELGKKVFSQHAGKHIDENKWSNRNIK